MNIWKRIYKSPTNNHLFVNEGVSGPAHLGGAGPTYICDNSGPDPEHTDDGPLRFHAEGHDRLVARMTPYGDTPSVSVKVIVEDEEDTYSKYTASVDLNAAIILGKRHNLNVSIETPVYVAKKKEDA